MQSDHRRPYDALCILERKDVLSSIETLLEGVGCTMVVVGTNYKCQASAASPAPYIMPKEKRARISITLDRLDNGTLEETLCELKGLIVKKSGIYLNLTPACLG